MNNHFVLTLDIDWAPDGAIDFVSDLLIEYQIKATWFVTHSSRAIESLRNHPKLFELGIHPNLLANSTHGNNIEEVMRYVLSLVPDSVSMRTHGVFQSGPFLSWVATNTEVKIDSSIFLPEMPNISPVTHLTTSGSLLRIPFFWSDDYELLKTKRKWDLLEHKSTNGLKVLLFHPIHVWLNTNDFSDYQEWKSNTDSPQPIGCPQSKLKRDTVGARTAFINLLSYLSANQSRTTRLVEFS